MRWIAMAALAAALSLPAVANARGGSNFMFYRVDGCEREPYGVLKNYHLQQAAIDDALITMRAAGQDRLRIPVSHLRGAAGGTNIDSTGGNFHAQYRDSFRDLLATVRGMGFSNHPACIVRPCKKAWDVSNGIDAVRTAQSVVVTSFSSSPSASSPWPWPPSPPWPLPRTAPARS